MDACWVYTVAWLFVGIVLEKVSTLPIPSPVALAIIILTAWGLAAFLLDKTRLPAWLVQALTIVAGLEVSVIVTAILTPPAGGASIVQWLLEGIPAITLCFILWMRGLYRAAGRPAFNEVYSDFQIGLAVTCLGALAAPLVAGGRFGALWAEIATLPIWFFVFALVALALGNREVVRQEIGAAAGGSWGVVLFASIGGIVLVGTLSAVFGGPNLIGIVQQMVAGAIVAVSSTIYGIMYAVLWLWYILFKPELKPLGQAPEIAPGTAQDQQREEALRRFREQQGQVQVPQELLQVGSWVAVILVGVLVLFVASMGVRRFRRRTVPDAMEDREKLGSWGLLGQQLRDWIGRLLARLRPRTAEQQGFQVDDLASLAGKPEWSGTLSVRQIYSRLLALAGKVGYPRAPHQTPVEYLGVLSNAMPELRNDFRDITAAYLEARYGPLPASSPAVLSAASAWSRAEPALKRANGAVD